ncbi:MAG: ankyrin repeat domain-containing protein [Alphaproteobacteria bacterium]|nr:ankyrin repeat domain-containing protein [Alphaproteobacteria bacterium]
MSGLSDIFNKYDARGMTRLHTAAENNDTDQIRRLINAGADPNLGIQPQSLAAKLVFHTPYVVGMSPLHIACVHGNLDAVKTLLRKGAHVLKTDMSQKTPLDYAVDKRDYYAEKQETLEKSFMKRKTAAQKAGDQVRLYDDVIRHMLKNGGRTHFFAIPEKFSELMHAAPPRMPRRHGPR